MARKTKEPYSIEYRDINQIIKAALLAELKKHETKLSKTKWTEQDQVKYDRLFNRALSLIKQEKFKEAEKVTNELRPLEQKLHRFVNGSTSKESTLEMEILIIKGYLRDYLGVKV